MNWRYDSKSGRVHLRRNVVYAMAKDYLEEVDDTEVHGEERLDELEEEEFRMCVFASITFSNNSGSKDTVNDLNAKNTC